MKTNLILVMMLFTFGVMAESKSDFKSFNNAMMDSIKKDLNHHEEFKYSKSLIKKSGRSIAGSDPELHITKLRNSYYDSSKFYKGSKRLNLKHSLRPTNYELDQIKSFEFRNYQATFGGFGF